MTQLIPAILSKSETEFREKLRIIDGVAPLLQLDVMDGIFVPNETWFDPLVLHDLKMKSSFEFHLMVKNPTEYIAACEELPNVTRVIWHIEAPVDHMETIRLVRHQGWQAGIAINPDTRLTEIEPFLDLIDEVLVMGSSPGFSGKALEMRSVDRVAEIHAHHPELAIGFDIGVNKETIPMLVKAGVTRLCTASAVFQEKDPKAAYHELAQFSQIR